MKHADLDIERERVERHWAYECDPCGHGVHDLNHVLCSLEPETLKLGKDVQGLELFQVKDLSIGKPEKKEKIIADCPRVDFSIVYKYVPEFLYEADIYRYEPSRPVVLFAEHLVHFGPVHDQPLVAPPDDEEGVQGDAELEVVNLGDVLDVDADVHVCPERRGKVFNWFVYNDNQFSSLYIVSLGRSNFE